MQSSRRDFLKYASCAASLVMAKGLFSSTAMAASAPQATSFEACMALTPQQMAESSPLVQQSWAYLQKQIQSLQDPSIRALVATIYKKPEPTLATRLDGKNRQAVWQELQAKGYTKQSEQDFLPPLPQGTPMAFTTLAAPGSGYSSHHAYPGGLITHLATNVALTDAIVNTYRTVYGYDVNRDIALAAQLLHDLHKPYVFQWLADASSRKEEPLAGTGQHHTLSLAELIVRKAPAALVVAQACAHTHPGWADEEKQVVNWLKAAAIIAGVDPVQYGLLDASGETLPQPRQQEGFLCHLGDHDFVLSVPAVKWTLPVMQKIARQHYGLSEADVNGKPFNALRNMVYSRESAMKIQHALAQEGEKGVQRIMASVVAPVKS